MAAVYDPFMRKAERACLSAWRQELMGPVHGTVLELGAGTGANLDHYSEHLRRLVLCEPDPHMRKTLTQRSHTSPLPSEVVDCSAECLPYENEVFDYVVATLVLCSVRSPMRALGEARRVLKASGKLVFLEHVAAEGNPGRLALQRACQPLWKRVAGNCHLTRPTRSLIEDAGFELVTYARESMRTALPVVRPCIRGVAQLA